jgi:hypothetical protein
MKTVSHRRAQRAQRGFNDFSVFCGALCGYSSM